MIIQMIIGSSFWIRLVPSGPTLSIRLVIGRSGESVPLDCVIVAAIE
jgi:hypothetical protein